MKNIITVSSNTFHGFSTEDALETISYAGFKYVELTAVKNWTEHIMADWSDSRKEAVVNTMKSLGLSCPVLSGHCNLGQDGRMGDFKKNIKLAHDLGCKYIVSSIDEAHYDPGNPIAAHTIIDNLRRLVPYLEEAELQMGIELHGPFGSGEVLRPLLDNVGYPERIGITYDTGNCVYFGKRNPETDITCCYDIVKTVHLKDKTGPDYIGIYPPLGDGDLKLSEFVSILLSKGYEGPFSIEIEFDADFAKKIKTDDDRRVVLEALVRSRKYLEGIGLM